MSNYKTQFPASDHPSAEWIAAVEATGAKDDSWGNDAAPSWSIASGKDHVTRFFYFTAENADNTVGFAHVEVVTEYCERPEDSFVCSPDDALELFEGIKRTGDFYKAKEHASKFIIVEKETGRDIGEGPWFTRDEAQRFADAEVGVEYDIRKQ